MLFLCHRIIFIQSCFTLACLFLLQHFLAASKLAWFYRISQKRNVAVYFKYYKVSAYIFASTVKVINLPFFAIIFSRAFSREKYKVCHFEILKNISSCIQSLWLVLIFGLNSFSSAEKCENFTVLVKMPYFWGSISRNLGDGDKIRNMHIAY